MLDIKIVKPTHKIKFMNVELEVIELTMKDLKTLETDTKDMKDKGLEEIQKLLSMSVKGMEDVTLDYLDEFPIRSLLELQQDIMEVNKLGNKGKI